MNIVEIKDLKKYYGQDEGQVKAVDGINLHIKKGEFLAIVGSSGSGKSSLLHLMGGLDKPTSGQVYIDNQPLYELKDEALTILRRRKIGFVFQNYNLIPTLNVYENIVTPILLDGKKPDADFISEITKTLGLSDKLKSSVRKLSGGQQQRVGLARALATKPEMILADEPTGNLDSKSSLEVLGLLKILKSQFSQTIVMITHNEEIAQMADRVIRIEDGKVCV